MIIKSLLDTDLYKLTMGQVALHQFSNTIVKYEFKCRNDGKFNIGHLARLKEEIKNFCSLRFTPEEIKYLSKIRFLKKSYIDFLKFYRPDPDHVTLKLQGEELRIIVEGPWFLTVYWEVPLLAMISEIYTEGISLGNFPRALERLETKKKLAIETGYSFVDFGTRRRFSREWHDLVIENLKELPNFKGTSNIFFAKEYGLTPIGTMAHEFLQVGQALDVPLVDSQKRMLQSWVDEYRGDLGIALTDVIGIDAFLKDFDLYFAKLYDGLRHDSGEPKMWAEKVIKHYKSLGIDPKTKTLVFSDGLDFIKAANLYNQYHNHANISFGIGTNLTNDLGGLTPLQIVMKITECNGRPVAKISDSPGKGMCKDEEYVRYLRKVFNR
ncbi:MAG: nicotinate phosphoribosyltransferase [Promethearchaeota archaeon]|jgi:nicotinate phosphoribosyltransferase